MTGNPIELMEQLDDAKRVKYDSTNALLHVWHGGHGIHIYNQNATEVDFYNVGDFKQDEADPETVEQAMEERINQK